MRTTDFRKIREEFIRIGIQVIGESSEGIGWHKVALEQSVFKPMQTELSHCPAISVNEESSLTKWFEAKWARKVLAA